MTDDHIVQVADRRLTREDGVVVEDEACKVTILGGRGVVAYSGLAFLGPPMSSTDFWMTDALGSVVEPSAAQRVLREAATERFARLSSFRAEQKCHAFVVAGWDAPDPDRAKPVIYTVSNALERDGRWRASADQIFTTHAARKHRKEPVVRTTGISLGKNAKPLAQSVRGHRASPVQTLATTLVRAVQQVARSEPAVGRNLLVTVVPRLAAGRDQDGVESWATDPAVALEFDPGRVTAL